MTLYEVLNGWMGESYVRCYVWAETEAQAREMAAEKLRQRGRQNQYTEKPTADLGVRALFSADSPAFCTAWDDAGWPEEWPPK